MKCFRTKIAKFYYKYSENNVFTLPHSVFCHFSIMTLQCGSIMVHWLMSMPMFQQNWFTKSVGCLIWHIVVICWSLFYILAWNWKPIPSESPCSSHKIRAVVGPFLFQCVCGVLSFTQTLNLTSGDWDQHFLLLAFTLQSNINVLLIICEPKHNRKFL